MAIKGNPKVLRTLFGVLRKKTKFIFQAAGRELSPEKVLIEKDSVAVRFSLNNKNSFITEFITVIYKV